MGTMPLRATYEQLARINDADRLAVAAKMYVSDIRLAIVPLHSIRAGRCTCGRPDCGSPGKHPRTPNGLHDASRDLDIIRGWWDRWPDANIGWPVPVGCAIVDVDDLDAADRLEATHGRIASPWVIKTGRGVHLVFQTATQVKNSVGLVAPGIDVRGPGGYSILPPSWHVSGAHYAWWRVQDDMSGVLEPTPLPLWLAGKLTARPAPTVTRRAVPTDHAPSDETFGEGRRNDGLTKIAGSLRRHGCDEATILIALETANRRQCSPPLDDREVQRIAASVSRYEPAVVSIPRKGARSLRFTAQPDRRAS